MPLDIGIRTLMRRSAFSLDAGACPVAFAVGDRGDRGWM